MSKPAWVNIGLFTLIILLSIYLFSPTQQADEETPVISKIDGETIHRIEISRKDLDDLIFHKNGGLWYMDSPLQFKADKTRMDPLLHLLKTASHAQLSTDENSLRHFALDAPEITLKMNEFEFRFGDTDAIDHRRYVLFNGTIHLTEDFLYQHLKTDAGFFAEKKLLSEKTRISKIKFPQNELNRVNNTWQLTGSTDMTPAELQYLVTSWEQAAAILTSTYREQKEESFITVFDENAQAIEFVIVATEPHLILARKTLGIQYHLGSDEAQKLLPGNNLITTGEQQSPDA